MANAQKIDIGWGWATQTQLFWRDLVMSLAMDSAPGSSRRDSLWTWRKRSEKERVRRCHVPGSPKQRDVCCNKNGGKNTKVALREICQSIMSGMGSSTFPSRTMSFSEVLDADGGAELPAANLYATSESGLCTRSIVAFSRFRRSSTIRGLSEPQSSPLRFSLAFLDFFDYLLVEAGNFHS